ncbi:MAG: patatin-like phospholipase family protein [Anaerolineae bacterium]|nr:patatin-like phospholipase family protein [Anaerolineae bacterium]
MPNAPLKRSNKNLYRPPSLFRQPLVGLALGGGGARGLAHIGVLKVLEQEQITIDCLSGTSMGGVIAAAYATGQSLAELETEALKMADLSRLARLVTWTPPWHSLLGSNRVRRYFTEILGDGLTFDTLRLPLALTAVDLLQGQEVILDQGSVIDAVLATTAIPGAFPPVEKDGHRLVDGGVLNNVPADVARQLGAELVIAVDVTPDISRHDPEENDESSPKPPLPAILRDIWQAELIMITVLSKNRLQQAKPEILIRPQIPIEVTVLTGFTRAREIIAAGEEATRAALPQIHKVLQSRLRRAHLTWRRLLSRERKTSRS